ncbi:DUF72 domain-containing protein [Chryseobacterium indologenes]|uniref:DUF72 domain-containing protein n=1 Tax=Chryseobacterium indologenes TaxID=253 RepID=UPI00076E30AB|nr:DUF72 domain-containing protein [Chryseobacterium indologenes]ATN05033.1 DUF72 domain-containing protein [Chryseobacterium indologenes]AYY86214.1 DUF72 domain-containing protein [Chryseobacterium indologenes]AYZ35986.1 DUF72 domain-containing protein [Chryseobacterium indologenes]MBF6644771.1 DUF72 domain-containing protein [Chryseobacterium indologenes]MBU3049889.1 DUF72 domain-containing protein [Chryseobacterium indologenes]
MKKENLYIGCSGFYNNDWKGSLYPENAPSKDFLSLYAEHFNCVEINSTFYRKPTAKTLLKWHDETPDHFRFFIKIPKSVTHQNRLSESKEEITAFCTHIHDHLKDKLSGFLYQLPPSFKNTQENTDRIIRNIDSNFLNVIEFRDESWWQKEIFSLLKRMNIIFSGVSFPGKLSEEVIINHPEVLYYRLHGKPVLYKSSYSDDFLSHLAEQIKNHPQKAFIFFNNTWGTSAIHNAMFLKSILE